MAHAICWRSGEVEVVSRQPAGSISLMRGPARRLERIISAIARHAYDGKTLLVPGLPEAEDDDAALAAVASFQSAMEKRLSAKRAA